MLVSCEEGGFVGFILLVRVFCCCAWKFVRWWLSNANGKRSKFRSSERYIAPLVSNELLKARFLKQKYSTKYLEITRVAVKPFGFIHFLYLSKICFFYVIGRFCFFSGIERFVFSLE